jgi:hypothetical protein
VPLGRIHIALVVAAALVGGCYRSAVGQTCYDVELVLEGPDP